MDSLPTGSDELLYVHTEKVGVTIKSIGLHEPFKGISYTDTESTLKILCHDTYELAMHEGHNYGIQSENSGTCTGTYAVRPMFFEQQRYEIIIEAESDDDQLIFWHDNLNIRNKITRASRRHNILSGVISLGNEIGYSDLVIQLNGMDYLRLVIEVYPSKIGYKDDYQAIMADVTAEVYNVVFDFLKKTYLGYQQGDRISSPVEFFAVIRKIYEDFIKAADTILARPHHILEATHDVLPAHKVRAIDTRGIRWIEKHPAHVMRKNEQILIDRTMAVRKQVTYDTKENRLTRYILLSVAGKLDNFRKNYLRLLREKDQAIITEIDDMMRNLNRRANTSFLAGVNAQESSSGLSLVFTMAPGYRELYKYYLMLLRGLSITGDVFQISIKDLAMLYEYWCFIKLNSMLKDRYEMISQDMIKVHGNGLFMSLIKGQNSKVKYRNPNNGDEITLSYNPRIAESPTVTQRPDNVLTLQKKQGTRSDFQYEYVFDAKYRINPALKDTDYYKTISHTPGPEVEDINAMHRYRDAIVYENDVSLYERTMFGAYVLFPYADLEKYKEHRFYKSINKVNIGGLPFLPSATAMVADMLDELIADSPDSAFERTTLPRGIEEKLARVDWSVRDVLVGSLRDRRQMDIVLKYRFYHIPANQLSESDLPIRYVAIYQSRNIFGAEAGIRYYGEVTKLIPVRRNEITEIPKESTELYYRLEVKEWKQLDNVIEPKEFAHVSRFTNLFLLEHSTEYPELFLRSEEEYRLYSELKRIVKNTEINGENNTIGFRLNDSTIIFDDGMINVYHNSKICARYDIREFTRRPNAVFRRMQKSLRKENPSS